MIDLHWRAGELLIIGVPRRYRYLVAGCHQDEISQRMTSLGSDKPWIANEESDGRREIVVPLKEGDFLFRARPGDVYRPNYEFEGNTDDLPVRLGLEAQEEYLSASRQRGVLTGTSGLEG